MGPYAIKRRLPSNGLGQRLAPLRAPAGRLGKTSHGGWLEQVAGSCFLAVGFRTAVEIEALRRWVVEQGWQDLLS